MRHFLLGCAITAVASIAAAFLARGGDMTIAHTLTFMAGMLVGRKFL